MNGPRDHSLLLEMNGRRGSSSAPHALLDTTKLLCIAAYAVLPSTQPPLNLFRRRSRKAYRSRMRMAAVL